MLTAAPQPYWDALYERRRLAYDEDSVLFKDVFDRYLPTGGSCFEVGCYPGNFLIYLGRRFGYSVSGIDATPGVAAEMEPFLLAHGVRIGQFYHGDVFKTPVEGQFDVVCSFGFVEHFPDVREVLRLHADLVAPGGRLVISCPNFRRVQWLLHRWLDPQNLSRHVTSSMDLRLWRRNLAELGLQTLYAGYYGTFDFWTEDPIRSELQRVAKRAIVRVGRGIDRRINVPTSWFSPHMILIAQRPF
jgi:SAM-dependent methyltransferase